MTAPMDENWDVALDEIRHLSDKLNGFVTTLVGEGWTEEQARTIVISMLGAQTKAAR